LFLINPAKVFSADIPHNWVHPPTWSDEFDQLFDNADPWSEVIEKSQVFGFFIGTSHNNTVEEMKKKVDFLKAHNLKIAVESGGTLGWDDLCEPKNQNGERSAEKELNRIQKIYDAGGKVSYLSLDGPVARLVKGGKGNCSFTEDEAIEELMDYIRIVKNAHPDIRIGLLSNFPQWSYGKYTSFRQKPGWGNYKQVLNKIFYKLDSENLEIDYVVADNPYNYIDMDYKEGDGIDRLLELEQQVRVNGLPFGLIFNSEAFRKGEGHQGFYEETLAFIVDYQNRGGSPDIRVIESWYRDHSNIFPEGERYTFMNTVRDGQNLFKHEPVIGALDIASCDRLGGWARDPNFPTESINVHIYKDASAGSGGEFITSVTADRLRPDLPFDNKNHGFRISLPVGFKTGEEEEVYIHGISVLPGDNPLLNKIPQTVNCPLAISPTPAINYKDVLSNWGDNNDSADFNDDNLVNGIDFGRLLNLLK